MEQSHLSPFVTSSTGAALPDRSFMCPATPDWQANITDYIFFCSEHPDANFPEFSNWYNMYYADGPYISSDGHLCWCSEQDLMLKKLDFCLNKELAAQKVTDILEMQPVPIIPVGAEGWEMVWESNHQLAAKMKNTCRSSELQLDVAAWDVARQGIMTNIIKHKFTSSLLKNVLMSTKALIIVEAAHYDSVFGVGLQAGLHYPRSKITLPDKCITELDTEGNEMWKVPPGPAWGTNLLGRALMAVRDNKE